MIQKKLSLITLAALLVFGLSFSNHLSASPVETSDLIISQIKVTSSSQFISLYNNSSQTIDMGSVMLLYFNNQNYASANTTKSIKLSGKLAAHGYYIINDGPLDLCYQARIQAMSLSLSSTNGLIEMVRISQPTSSKIEFISQDLVAWSNAKNSTLTMPKEPYFLQRQQSNGKPQANGKWQQVKQSDSNPCDFIASNLPETPNKSRSNLLPASPPPAKIVSLPPDANSNAGLKAPQITELLPNPASPQTDSKDEFIEIYNSNNAEFDLGGYKLQTASNSATSKSTYTFPTNTKIAAKSYAAYPSANVSVSLVNDGGKASLLDSSDKVISQTEKYSKSVEGQSWSLANGKWYWTVTPSPNKSNVITASASKLGKSGIGTVKGVATTDFNAKNLTPNSSQQSKSKPISTSLLVGVATLAVVYGIYEYRRDLANWFQKLKRNRAAGRKNRSKT